MNHVSFNVPRLQNAEDFLIVQKGLEELKDTLIRLADETIKMQLTVDQLEKKQMCASETSLDHVNRERMKRILYHFSGS